MSLFQFGFTRSSRNGIENNTQEPLDIPSYLPNALECGLGIEEHSIVTTSVSEFADPEPSRKKRKIRVNILNTRDEDRAKIGRYANENGNKKARKHFFGKFPRLTESTVRNFKAKYMEKIRVERKKSNPQRPPILLELDGKLLNYLKAARTKDGVVNIHVVRAATQGLIASNPAFAHRFARFEMPRTWVQSIYRRMGYTRRVATTPVPQGIYDECRREFLNDIKEKMTLYSIPPELVLNSDQTPSSYVSVGKSTMHDRGANSVPIQGLKDKRNITLTFVVSLSGEFLPMQIIYAGKTKASLPRGFIFPKGFSLSQNPQHWSNETETLKLVDEIINPYVILGLASTQKALVIWDVFKGQMTNVVKQKLELLDMELVAVPANMIHFFQPLDLTVNGAAKSFAKKEFITYYSAQVQQQLEGRTNLEDINVDLRLSMIKPLHAQWLVNMYNFFTQPNGRKVILKGWKKAGIAGLLDNTTLLSPEDPFETIFEQES